MSAGEMLRRKAKRIQSEQEQAVRAGARIYKAEILAQAKRDTGGDLKLSGLKNGKKLTVATKVYRHKGDVVAKLRGGPGRQRAPWFWLEFGTRGGPRRKRSVLRERTLAGVRLGVARIRTFDHPGTDPKRTWSRPTKAKRDEVTREIQRRLRAAIRG